MRLNNLKSYQIYHPKDINKEQALHLFTNVFNVTEIHTPTSIFKIDDEGVVTEITYEEINKIFNKVIPITEDKDEKYFKPE